MSLFLFLAHLPYSGVFFQEVCIFYLYIYQTTNRSFYYLYNTLEFLPYLDKDQDLLRIEYYDCHRNISNDIWKQSP